MESKGEIKMFELHPSYVPYVANQDLDSYAEKMLREFIPELLKCPQTIDIDDFSEFHLGLKVEYRRLTRDGRILGITMFSDGVIQSYNTLTGKLELSPVSTGTVLIDTSLTNGENRTRRRFTLAHECSHWILHRHVFATKKWNSEYMVSRTSQASSISRKDEENRRRMERQANYMAAALLMPISTLRMLFREFCQGSGIQPRKLVRSMGDGGLAHAFVELVAERYQVSHIAARIRLETLGAIGDNP